VFVSEAWFRTWHGIPNDWLTLITAHEVAHQWWYALVGSDQGRTPYLDEALATYSELLFIDRYYPDQHDWWWGLRVDMYAPAGFVDTPVYDFYSPRSYIDAVYLRGAQMMDALRDILGDEVFFEWLRAYADALRHEIAAPADLWGTLPPDAYAATAAVRSLYLMQPDVLASPSASSYIP
jgi:aminopeptidase N